MNTSTMSEQKNLQVDDDVWWFRTGLHEKGPFTLITLKEQCKLHFISPTTLVSKNNKSIWTVAADYPELWGYEINEPPDETGRWRIAAAEHSERTSFDFSTLQMYAAQQWLRRHDLVRELPDGDWQKAFDVTGLFIGQRQWCIACGLQLYDDYAICSGCGKEQPDYEHTNATAALILATLGLLVYTGGIFLLAFAIRAEWMIMDSRVDEHYLEIFTILLIVTAGFATMSIFLGMYATKAICEGRDSPQFARRGVLATRMGLVTASLVIATIVAIIAFTFRHFW